MLKCVCFQVFSHLLVTLNCAFFFLINESDQLTLSHSVIGMIGKLYIKIQGTL